jgi:hypothetical protein
MSMTIRLIAVPLVCLLTSVALAMQSSQAYLDDFVHYALTANPDLASANAQALLDSGITNAELAELMEGGTISSDRFDRAISWAQYVDSLEPMATELAQRLEDGRLELARSEVRIQEAIDMLGGTLRQQMIAQERLTAAGEYAVPGLLDVLTDVAASDHAKWSAGEMLTDIGRQAVSPLATALPYLSPKGQQTGASILGSIGYPHAAPALVMLMTTQGTEPAAREAAARALARLENVPAADLASLNVLLGQKYLDGTPFLISDPHGQTNLVWTWEPGSGLIGTPVPTQLFGSIMAMRHAASALSDEPQRQDALSLFVAADLSRDNLVGSGLHDPIFSDRAYSPQFYATVFGTRTGLDVLQHGLDRYDTPLVRDAIAALSETGGEISLFSEGGSDTLVSVLSYPDRRVQYEMALALTRSVPRIAFPGDHRIVPILASAIRDGDATYALVIAETDEDRAAATVRVEALGLDVIDSAAEVDHLLDPISSSPGIDMVYVKRSSAAATTAVIDALRALSQTTATPILVSALGRDAANLTATYRTDPLVVVVRSGATPEAVTAAAEMLMYRGLGAPLSEIDAEIYAVEALSALRDLALSDSSPLDVTDAETALIDALSNRSGRTKLMAAEALSLIDSSMAQQALLESALASEDGTAIDLLDFAASSVRRYGHHGRAWHIAGLLTMIQQGDAATAEAAARVYGAMNEPAEAVILLIPESSTF